VGRGAKQGGPRLNGRPPLAGRPVAEKSSAPTQLGRGSRRFACMNHFVLDLTLGISLGLVLADDGILVARWLWCDLRVGAAEVGVA
jgi:hypothetical protein